MIQIIHIAVNRSLNCISNQIIINMSYKLKNLLFILYFYYILFYVKALLFLLTLGLNYYLH